MRSLYVATSHMFQFSFRFLSCYNAVFMLCLDLGTKHLVRVRETPWFGLKIPVLVTTKTAGDGPTSHEK